MKIKEDLMLRNIAEEWIVIPMGARLLEFNGMIKINDSAAFLWKLLEQETTKETLIRELQKEYALEEEQAIKEVTQFIENLEQERMIEV